MGVDIERLSPAKFPARLREIPDQPTELYLQGTLPPEEHKWLAVVGSRKCTAYGREVTEMLVKGLQGYPIVIVSGLALGIDTLAHKSALTANLPTVVVPGSGLDRSVLHPPTNRRLAEEILAAGGALLTEFPPRFPASLWGFPRRNRIMAGLSDAVLIIEAEERSGTLITSRLATDYNRDVLTVPGSIFSSHTAGPHMLIRLGATPVTSSADLLQALGFKTDEKSVRDYSLCTKEEKEIVALLASPLSREELLDGLPFSIGQANTLLSTMELKGLIKESAGEIHLI